MVRKTINVVCRWGGRICEDDKVGIYYEGGHQGCFRSKIDTHYDDFLSRLHTIAGVDKNEYLIIVTSRHPCEVGPHGMKYVSLDVSNDDSLEVALYSVGESNVLQQAEFYLDVIQYVDDGNNQMEEVNERNTEMEEVNEGYTQMEEVNEGYDPGASSNQQEASPLDHIVDVVFQENPNIAVTNRGFSEVPEDSDGDDGEDEIIEAIDNDEDGDQDNSEEDEVEPLHDPGASFYHDIGEDRPCGYYTPPGVFQCSDFDHDKDDLSKGLLFNDKEALKVAVANYNIKRMKQYTVTNSNKKLFEVHCYKRKETGCLWKLRGSLQQKHNKFEVVTYIGPHTCLYPIINEGHRQLKSDIIGSRIKSFIQEDPSFKVCAIRTLIKETYNYDISYYKAWYAKQNVIASIYGDWDTSYARLPKLLSALQKYNPGTIVVSDVQPTHHPSRVFFQRLFWSFGACIEAFVHLRPVLCVDATHMYGKYKGRLLIAQGLDANRNVLPIAFAFVDEENAYNWGWFLRLVRVHCVFDREVCLISDRHAGILSAVENRNNGWLPPLGHHRYCVRHFQSNFNTRFKNSSLKAMVWQAAVQTEPRKFDEVMTGIRGLNQDAYTWLMSAPLDKWTLCHDGGRRWGEMTTNVVESFNGVLKGARSLPISACVLLIFYRLVKYFELRRTVGISLIDSALTHTEDAIKRYTRYQEFSAGHRTRLFNRSTGETSVTTPHGSVYVVILNNGSCSCGRWTAYKIPCSHALAVCRVMGVDSMLMIDNLYSLETYRQTYTSELHPLHHEAYWDEYVGPAWTPEARLLRNRGRPRSTRFTNEMDVRSRKKCSLCRVEGHTRRNCSLTAGQRSAARDMQ